MKSPWKIRQAGTVIKSRGRNMRFLKTGILIDRIINVRTIFKEEN